MNPQAPEFAKACDFYCKLMAEGKGSKDALKASKLSHSQADRAWYASEANPNRTVVEPNFLNWSPARQAAFVVEERAKGLSWGRIAIRTGFIPRLNSGGLSEGQVQGLFGRTTGIAPEGTRVGHGGRFLEDQPLRYLGNRKGIGVEAPKPRLVNPLDPKFVETADKVKSVLPAKVAAAKKAAAKKVATTEPEAKSA